MPRAKRTAPDPDAVALGAKDQMLPGLDMKPDPTPRRASGGTGRPPGRPRTKTGPRDAAGRPLSKTATVDKVRADLYAIIAPAAAIAAAKDPCGEVLFESVNEDGTTRIEAIIERAVGMIAKREKVLNAVANAGLLVEVAATAGLVFPIIATVWRHHGPGGVGHDQPEQVERDANLYPAHR